MDPNENQIAIEPPKINLLNPPQLLVPEQKEEFIACVSSELTNNNPADFLINEIAKKYFIEKLHHQVISSKYAKQGFNQQRQLFQIFFSKIKCAVKYHKYLYLTKLFDKMETFPEKNVVDKNYDKIKIALKSFENKEINEEHVEEKNDVGNLRAKIDIEYKNDENDIKKNEGNVIGIIKPKKVILKMSQNVIAEPETELKTDENVIEINKPKIQLKIDENVNNNLNEENNVKQEEEKILGNNNAKENPKEESEKEKITEEPKKEEIKKEEKIIEPKKENQKEEIKEKKETGKTNVKPLIKGKRKILGSSLNKESEPKNKVIEAEVNEKKQEDKKEDKAKDEEGVVEKKEKILTNTETKTQQNEKEDANVQIKRYCIIN